MFYYLSIAAALALLLIPATHAQESKSNVLLDNAPLDNPPLDNALLDRLGREPKDLGLLMRQYLAEEDLGSVLDLYHQNAFFYPADSETAIVGRVNLKAYAEKYLSQNSSITTISNGERTQTIVGKFAIVKSPYKLVTENGELSFLATEVIVKNDVGEWVYLIDSPFGSP